MAELFNNAYKELEMESIKRSMARFEEARDQSQNKDANDAFDIEDPRVIATEAMAISVGFSMEVGQYIDIQK